MKLLFLKSDLAKMGSVDFDCHECLASHNILNTSKGTSSLPWQFSIKHTTLFGSFWYLNSPKNVLISI